MAIFLSDDWFAQVNDLTVAAGDLNLPAPLANLCLNMNVDGIEFNLTGGTISKGYSPSAKTTLTMDAATLRTVFLEFDMSAAMNAFMTGKIKVAGDMTALMPLQSARPSAEQKALFEQVLSITA